MAEKKGDTYSYKGWLTSDSFWKRAVGTFLYFVAGYVIVVLPFAFVLFLLGFLSGLLTR